MHHHSPWLLSRRQMVLATMAAACSTPLASILAADSDDGAAEPVATLNTGLLAAMKAGHATPFAARYTQLAPLIERVFDLPAILKATVGLRWAGLSADDQATLLAAFRRFTVSSYVASFSNFGGERFVILPDRRNVGDATVVATQIVPKTGNPARLDYVLRQTPDAAAWKIFDILLDGSISQVAVQRSQFHGLLGDGGAGPLIALLDNKSASLAGAS